MPWRAMGLTNIARHVTGWHLIIKDTRVQSALDDVAGNGPVDDLAISMCLALE